MNFYPPTFANLKFYPAMFAMASVLDLFLLFSDIEVDQDGGRGEAGARGLHGEGGPHARQGGDSINVKKLGFHFF